MKQSLYNRIILIVDYSIYKKIQNREKLNNKIVNKTVVKANKKKNAKKQTILVQKHLTLQNSVLRVFLVIILKKCLMPVGGNRNHNAHR